MTGERLVGRDLELALLSSLLEGLAVGRPFVLTVRGQNGSGRSALLDAARSAADEAGVRVLSARGVDAIHDPPFGALSSLFRPLIGEANRHCGPAAPGADALRSAVALSSGAVAPDDVRVGALHSLTSASDTAPVLLLLDDTERMDQPSLDVLSFALGRVGVEPIGAVCACIPGAGPLDGVTTDVLPLPGLSTAALADLACATAPCTDAVAQTVACWAEGSPLLAVELTRSLTADERDGSVALPDAPRPTVLMVDRLQRELDALDPVLQRALVVAAADRTGSIGVIARALRDLGERPDVLDAVEETDLVSVGGGGLRFRHALIRPLAYGLVAPASRRAAHRALAGALVEPEQATERVRQLVASTAGPDEVVAGLLDLVAAAARGRGSHAATASALAEAARLSPDPRDRGRRLLDAARAHQAAGDAGPARAAARSAAELGATGARELLDHLEAAPAVDGLVGVLSAAEIRVAEAVASGLTNRQAADSLFLSAKTVDFHLQSIYRKLAIRSRAELATLVARRGARP